MAAHSPPTFHPSRQGVNPHLTVSKEIFYCGVTDGALFDGDTKAESMATELFYDELSSCMYKTYEEFDEDLKSYSNLTIVNGKISIGPGQNKNIKASIQCTRNNIRLVLDPDLTRLPVVNASDYIKIYKHHEAYIKKSKTITEMVKPEYFANKVK